ncbi:MAG: c-type cytochrome [Rhizobium sp.]|nr:c-type cytochrome [Rhizobium sp.]
MSKFRKPLLLAAGLLLASTAVVFGGDVAAGKKVFGKCVACHMVGENAKHKVGPTLNDVVGRQAGTAEGYNYSPAMKNAGLGGLVWDDPTLHAYLAKPRDIVKGTKMTFAGLKKENDITDVIAYLSTFSQAAPHALEVPKAEEAPKTEESAAPEAAKPAEVAAAEAAPEQTETAASQPTAGVGAHLGLGREATPEEIAAWDIDVRPDGLGLPEGRGTVAEGMAIYDEKCAACHGDFGEAVGRRPVLAGGHGTLQADRPEKTIGSFWPYLSTVYDYVRRAMPFGDARSLSDDDVYALTAYLLYLNDEVTDEDFELSKDNFASIRLPNEANFIDDDRLQEPHYRDKSEPCMTNCVPGKAAIKMHAAVLDVTPQASGDDKEPAGGGID